MFDAFLWLFAFFAGLYATRLVEQKKLTPKALLALSVVSGVGLLISYLNGFFSLLSILVAVLIVAVIGAVSTLGRRPLAPNLYYRHRDCLTFFLSRLQFPSTADVASVTKRVRLPSGEPFILFHSRPLTPLRSGADNDGGGNGRACVFAKMKPRLYLPWLDAAYYVLLHDLKQCGCTPVIYLYDFDFRVVDSTVPEVPIKTDLVAMVRNTKSFIRHLVGSGTLIIQGTQYFRRRKPAQHLHDFLYTEVFPKIAVETVQWSDASNNAHEVRARELLFQLHGYPTILVAKLLAKHQPVYALQWEGRADKWDMTAVDRNIQILVTKTLVAQHRPLRILESIHMTDNSQTIRDKLRRSSQYGGDEELRLMCSLLLYRDELPRYDWNAFVSTAGTEDISTGVHSLIDAGFLEQADSGSLSMAMNTMSKTSLNREALAGSKSLASAYLHKSVFDGIETFQRQHGLKPYVIR